MSFSDHFTTFVDGLSKQAGFGLGIEDNTTAFKYDDVIVVLDLPDEREPFMYAYAALFTVGNQDRAGIFETLLAWNMPNGRIPGTQETRSSPRIAYEKESDRIYCWERVDISAQGLDSVQGRLSLFCECCMALVNEFEKPARTPSEALGTEIIRDNFLRI